VLDNTQEENRVELRIQRVNKNTFKAQGAIEIKVGGREMESEIVESLKAELVE
jgi:hypothetical protein